MKNRCDFRNQAACPNVISEMESGKRPIPQKTAKRLGEEFDLPYKVFL
ncbi:MAG: hypothetical protein LBC79_09300 [Deltaproteobacteria bacterium]|jgi:hypothetical protein|nr:hypothetical protein [Deltaproteobacteria bacterium]